MKECLLLHYLFYIRPWCDANSFKRIESDSLYYDAFLDFSCSTEEDKKSFVFQDKSIRLCSFFFTAQAQVVPCMYMNDARRSNSNINDNERLVCVERGSAGDTGLFCPDTLLTDSLLTSTDNWTVCAWVQIKSKQRRRTAGASEDVTAWREGVLQLGMCHVWVSPDQQTQTHCVARTALAACLIYSFLC